jgi:argininosuccinate lyase
MAKKSRKPRAGRGGERPAPDAGDQKLWAGRFEKQMNPLVEDYTSSIEQDALLLPHDILGSIAHASMLGSQGIIPQADADKIVSGLNQIAADAQNGRFELRGDLEDVHMNVESELERRIGRPAGRLHTARSRNDQVVTDFRMSTRDMAYALSEDLVEIESALVDLAEQQLGVIMPGYTHLQRAQPVLLSHHLMAYFEMFHRDEERFLHVAEAANVSALGSGALAGAPYPLNRQLTAEMLGFEEISHNSMDAVSDRDFVIEFLSAAAISMMHVSRLAEEIVLWSTREFGFITLDDAFSTGSSIMPQKKNPDVAELARGRTAKVYGNLMAGLTLMKALPLTYNRDLQEDKQPLYESAGLLGQTLQIFAEMLPTIHWNTERMRAAAAEGYALATDVADYLTRKGMPFREAHNISGQLVRLAESQGNELDELALDEYRRLSPLFEEDVLAIDLESSVNSRDVPGGTARNRVQDEIARARELIKQAEDAGIAGLPDEFSGFLGEDVGDDDEQ